MLVLLYRPHLTQNLPTWLLAGWNILFTLALAGTILAHRVTFPNAPDAPAVVVGPPGWLQQVPLWGMLLLFPILYVDFNRFAGQLSRSGATPRQLAPGFLLGALLLVVLIFMQIFSNVWGYVEPVSTYFRNQFWLPFALAAGVVTVLILPRTDPLGTPLPETPSPRTRRWLGLVAVALMLGTAVGLWWTRPRPQPAADKNQLVVMTYNIQQANDQDGQKSYLQQLALIQEVQPDLIGLQESDSARISLGNNDYVRFYAGKLGYFSYYGPKTVTGTYGTALLSRYPLIHPRHFFTYSDQDEIGSVEAQIEVGGRTIAVFNVHPDGSDAAMLSFAQALIERAEAFDSIIAMGDYNLRQGEAAFELIDAVYKDAWLEADTPGMVQGDGQGIEEAWIDHIFVSPELLSLAPIYRLPPASATDHPALWATIAWPER
jgi:endonuclease/exonuclease/phosphatase family metal-dependent hydrolase